MSDKVDSGEQAREVDEAQRPVVGGEHTPSRTEPRPQSGEEDKLDIGAEIEQAQLDKLELEIEALNRETQLETATEVQKQQKLVIPREPWLAG